MKRGKVFLIGGLIGAALVLVFANRAEPLKPLPAPAEKILVEKRAHKLTLFKNGQVIATYRIALGHGGLASKHHAGDGLTPEGLYTIDSRKADSAFHKALHISYPSPADRAAAGAADPGGAIMIHGLRNGMGWVGAAHRQIDWTNGCIALTDAEIDQIWNAVPNGTPIEIRP